MRQALDLDLGETVRVVFDDGWSADIGLLQVESEFDGVRGAVRRSRVLVNIDGEETWIESGNYNLPVTVGGMRIDCPITRDYYENTNEDRWGLRKDARLRVWRSGCPLFGMNGFGYPVQGQRWLPNRSQAGNEPTDDYIPFMRSIYYHSGIDFGGTEGVDRIVAAVPGLVVLSHGEVLPGYEDTPAQVESDFWGTRTDVVYILDDNGWFYRYSHLHSTEPWVRIGERVKRGDPIGLLGKEGTSGGWSHLHFEIICRQPSGEWGTESSYPYLWEHYVNTERPGLLAIARPHRYGAAGDEIELDGSRSVSFDGEMTDYEWTFTDGSRSHGERVSRVYSEPGFYTELLKVTDDAGNTAYDFAVVQIVHTNQHLMYSYLHAAHTPSKGISVGDEILFKARTLGIGGGEEAWDFGDNSAEEYTQSDNSPFGGYAEIRHTYTEPGDYFIRVERTNQRGEPMIARLWVTVGE